jgi:hypothetical protein
MGKAAAQVIRSVVSKGLVFLAVTNRLDHEDVVRSGRLRKNAVRVRLHPVSFPFLTM